MSGNEQFLAENEIEKRATKLFINDIGKNQKRTVKTERTVTFVVHTVTNRMREALKETSIGNCSSETRDVLKKL